MRMQICSKLMVVPILFCLPLGVTAFQSDIGQGQNTSQGDKAKKCDETAKKRGLKGDERATFVSSCMAAKDSADAATSPEEKAKMNSAQSCDQQATQKGLTGKARKNFVKTCTSATAPK